MDRSKLSRIGILACAHGNLSPERYTEAATILETLEEEPSAEAFWIGLGFLDEPTFAQLLDLLEGPPTDVPTKPYPNGPPSSSPRSAVPSPRQTLEIPLLSPTRLYESPQSLFRTRAIAPIEVLSPPNRSKPPIASTNQTLVGGVLASSTPNLPKEAPATPPPIPTQHSIHQPRYQEEHLLGSGGMGEVYNCIDSILGRHVAIKRLHSEGLEEPLAITMLEREARVLGSLEHPNIIPVYDAGYLDTTGPFYAMRLVKRPSLEVLLHKLQEGDSDTLAEFSLHRLLRAFIQVCGAIDYAHSKGIIHCDLKPANLLLGALGEVLVVDWGMAYSPNETSAYQGGTPAYMAPEQFKGLTPDPRTDVYALGAILYEILTLRPAFPDRPSLSLHPRQPVHPRSRAPERTIPDELADAALQALKGSPEARFPSARALGAAIESFLEGTREKERRLLRANELSEQGDLLADSYEELLESRPERIAEIQELLRHTAPWESPEQKQPLWDAEDRQTVLDALCIRTFQSAVSAFEQALEESPLHEAARHGLARLYRAELRRAHERRDDFDRVYFEGLLKQVETNPQDSSASSSLSLETLPESMEIFLGYEQEEARRLQILREEPLGFSPIRRENLSTGSYRLRIQRYGFPDILHPVLLRPGEETHLTLDLNYTAPKPGEIFIPGGVALLGGDETNLHGRDLHEIYIAPFYIATFPVSFQEYFEFVAAMFVADPIHAPRFLPKSTEGSVLWLWSGDSFEPASSLLRWNGEQDYLFTLPAFGIDIGNAEAYAQWKSENTGRRYRLPTEDEWEKAARGTDGRKYPWGDRFDASFCKMRESRPDLPAPEPCGTFPTDISPYGVRDMAGGIAEWVLPSTHPQGLIHQIASRGGAWCDWRVDCHLSARRAYFLEERSARVGFRLVREPSAPQTRESIV